MIMLDFIDALKTHTLAKPIAGKTGTVVTPAPSTRRAVAETAPFNSVRNTGSDFFGTLRVVPKKAPFKPAKLQL